jgi:nicotinamide phosphoribosyltransferase
VFKQPVTDEGKRSKAGRLKLIRRGSSYATVRDTPEHREPDLLVEVFLDGEVCNRQSWEDICERAALQR